MTITNGYCTRNDLQKKLGNYSDNNNDYFDACITDASRMIDEYTGTFFYSMAINSTIDRFSLSPEGLEFNDRGDRLYFPAPIISITSITEGGVALTEDTDFYVYSGERYIKRDTWSSERKSIVIAGSIGYAAAPADIKRVCLEIAGVLSGVETRAVMDGAGDMIDVIKNSVPSWAWKHLNKHKRIFV
jgi:hypothetical protein